MKNTNQEYRIGIGAASMLLIFIMLCITTLAVLSLSSARADLTLTKRNVTMQRAYHTASAKAQETISAIDNALMEAAGQASTQAEYEALVEALTLPEVALSAAKGSISFEVDAGFERSLEVVLSLAEHGGEGPRYTIARHTLRNDAPWETEDDTTVFIMD